MAAPEPNREELRVGADTIHYVIRTSARAQRMRIRVGPAGVELVVPAGLDPTIARAFLREQSQWVIAQLKPAAAFRDAQAGDAHTPATQSLQFEHAGRIMPYVLKRSARARQVRITINENGITLTMPALGSAAHAHAFLKARGAWVLGHVDRIATLKAAQPNNRTELLLRGERYAVRVEHDRQHKTATGTLDSGTFVLRLPDPHAATDWLVAWLKAEARRDVAARVRARSEEMALRPARLFLRDQRTRWGTCSSRKNISLNWRLIHAPPAVLDYVVVHELAHLRELNHSKRFWAIVEQHCPDYKLHAAWLKKNGGQLRQLPAL
jgi:predicted metal-dependent hydrolase